jgi:hypothetical protein
MATPASAGDPIIGTTTWSGQYQGRALSCDVLVRSEVDFDDLDPPRTLVYYATSMVDEGRRCREAIGGVAAYVTYRSTDGTTDVYESTSTGSDTSSIARVQDPPDDVVVRHVAYFRCDSNPNGCEHRVTTHPYPFGSK